MSPLLYSLSLDHQLREVTSSMKSVCLRYLHVWQFLYIFIFEVFAGSTVMWTLNNVVYYYPNWFLCTVYAFWWCIIHCSNNVGVKTNLIERLCITRPVGEPPMLWRTMEYMRRYTHQCCLCQQPIYIDLYCTVEVKKWSFYDRYKSKTFYHSSQYKCVLRGWHNSFVRGRGWMSLTLWNILKF